MDGESDLETRRKRLLYRSVYRGNKENDILLGQFARVQATQAPAGTREKLEVLAERVRSGHPLWHDDDRADYSGLTGAIRPRD